MSTFHRHLRTDSGSRLIKADPSTIYRALTTPEGLAAWRAPKGMTGEVYQFEARAGGMYRMALRYEKPGKNIRGKTSADADVFEGRFLELVPDQRVVEVVEFDSGDPAFAGAMTITTSLTPVEGGTTVTIVIENVPEGISAEDHQAGIASSLENLAAYTEQ